MGMKKPKTLRVKPAAQSPKRRAPVTFQEYADQGLIWSFLFKQLLLPKRSTLRVSKEVYKRLLAEKRAQHKLEEEEHLSTAKAIELMK